MVLKACKKATKTLLHSETDEATKTPPKRTIRSITKNTAILPQEAGGCAWRQEGPVCTTSEGNGEDNQDGCEDTRDSKKTK